MDYSLISIRYTKALYSLSVDKDITDKVNADMQMISEQFKENKELDKFLSSLVVPAPQKKKLFRDVFGPYTNETTMKFLLMLVDNGREAMLSSIVRDFIDMYKKSQGTKTVSLYTAVEFNKTYLENIKALLAKELHANIELNVTVKEDLIGGFMLMLDGKLMDTSISTKLKQIRKQLLD